MEEDPRATGEPSSRDTRLDNEVVTQESIELPLQGDSSPPASPQQPSLQQPSLPRYDLPPYKPPQSPELRRTDPDGPSEDPLDDLPDEAATLLGGAPSPLLDLPEPEGDTAPTGLPPPTPEGDTALTDAPLPEPEGDTSPTSAPAPRPEESTGRRRAPAHGAEVSTQEMASPSMELPEETETVLDPGARGPEVWTTQPNARAVVPPSALEDLDRSYERSLIPLQDDIEEPSRVGRGGFTRSEFRLFKALGIAVALFIVGVGVFTLYLVMRTL